MLLVLDNLAGHKTPEFVCWLFAHGIMPLYTPVGGSWLNMAESIQRILKRRALDGQHPTDGERDHGAGSRRSPGIGTRPRRRSSGAVIGRTGVGGSESVATGWAAREPAPGRRSGGVRARIMATPNANDPLVIRPGSIRTWPFHRFDYDFSI